MSYQDNKNTLRFILGVALVLALVYVLNPISRENILVYLVLLGVSYFVYIDRSSQSELIGIGSKNLYRSVFWAVIIGGGFYLTTQFLPGFSLGLPLLPGAISDQLQFFIIVIIAPIVEEIFFRGAVLAYIRKFNPSKSKLYIFIILQALIFAAAHLTAYITGFYNYPSFAAGLTAINANLASFGAAFIFAFLAGWFVSKDGIRNLTFSILLHGLVNFIIFTKLTVIFS